MRYVYILQSINFPERFYVGSTNDIARRILEHNQDKSHYSSIYAPWKLKTYTAFTDDKQANDFERYLKTSSGRAFAIKRL
jgi:predicted GIY-YIG superfamily endonuclease